MSDPVKLQQALDKRDQERRDAEALHLMVHYTPEQRSQALSLFLVDGMEPAAIALQMQLPLIVIENFAKEDKWLDRRREIEEELVQVTLAAERRLILEHRVKVRRRHLEAAEKLEKRAEDMALDENATDSAHKLKSAIEAFASAAGLSAKAAGLEDNEGNVKGGAGVSVTVNPVIMVGAQPRAPRMKSVIEVQDAPPMSGQTPRVPAQVAPAETPRPAEPVDPDAGREVRAVPDPGEPGDRPHPRDEGLCDGEGERRDPA